jgi:hypothetical protein
MVIQPRCNYFEGVSSFGQELMGTYSQIGKNRSWLAFTFATFDSFGIARDSQDNRRGHGNFGDNS